MIDAAGLKGARVGDAEVSAVHANFIINRGEATGSDVITLVRNVRARVKQVTGVTLEPEVILYGRDWQGFGVFPTATHRNLSTSIDNAPVDFAAVGHFAVISPSFRRQFAAVNFATVSYATLGHAAVNFATVSYATLGHAAVNSPPLVMPPLVMPPSIRRR